jgi:hypothetical protein
MAGLMKGSATKFAIASFLHAADRKNLFFGITIPLWLHTRCGLMRITPRERIIVGNKAAVCNGSSNLSLAYAEQQLAISAKRQRRTLGL